MTTPSTSPLTRDQAGHLPGMLDGLRVVELADETAEYVGMARKSALKARVEKYIQFDVARVQDVLPPAPTGLLATNLPYGDRIGGGEAEVRQLYEEFGDTLKQRFAGWRAVVLAASASPFKAIGLKPSRTTGLMNGSIPCRLLLFDLYAGSRRPAPSSTAPAAPSIS